MADSSGTAVNLRFSDVTIAVAVILVVVMMIIPIPTGLLSFFLIFNITLALIILMISLLIQETLEFSVFPTMLLIMTLFRLSLNISTTRQILLNAYAGQVVQKFGSMVIGGNPVVGFIIFLILVIVQFIVITRGAERISEVAARFTLDAMPGKQMSIDADLNAGIITDKEARQRRAKIQAEADFYGSMDGATKFVRGDAIASLIILVINVLGGFIIGIAQKGMGFQDALSTYTLLTVGDGLVTQIPALLISTASGIIVTRTGGVGTNFTSDLTKQLLSYPKALSIACGILILLALLGMPPVPVLGISAITGFAAYAIDRSSKQIKRKEVETARTRELDEMKKLDNVLGMVQVDALEIELGYNLIPLVDIKRGGDLLDRVLMIRKQCALDLGIVVPPVRVRDNMQLDRSAYAIKIRGSVVGKGNMMIDHYLAIGPDVKSRFQGVETVEPTFGLPALWVAGAIKDEVETAGFTVVEPSAVVATHLTEIVKRHAYEIVSRQDVQNMLDNAKKTNSAVVNELTPLLGLGEIHKVLSHLLREGVSIRDLNTILETLADSARLTKDSAFLTEYVRQALGRQITSGLLEADQKLYVLTFEPGLEQSLKESLPKNEQGAHLNLDPLRAQRVIEHLRVSVEKMIQGGHQPVVLCSPVLRFYFKRLSEKILPNLTVLSYNELQPEIQVESLGMISG